MIILNVTAKNGYYPRSNYKIHYFLDHNRRVAYSMLIIVRVWRKDLWMTSKIAPAIDDWLDS